MYEHTNAPEPRVEPLGLTSYSAGKTALKPREPQYWYNLDWIGGSLLRRNGDLWRNDVITMESTGQADLAGVGPGNLFGNFYG